MPLIDHSVGEHFLILGKHFIHENINNYFIPNQE